MSEPVFIELIKVGLPLVATIVQIVMAYFMAKLNHKASEAAVKVAEAKEELDIRGVATAQKLNEIKEISTTAQKTTEATHSLVNGSFSVQLKVAWIALRKIADLTKDPDDIKAADEAEKLYQEHEAKQQRIEVGEKIQTDPKRTAAFSESEHEKAKSIVP